MVPRGLRHVEPRFPRGHYASLTWSIPEHFGGLTTVMLHRARTFARFGRSIELLTLAPCDDLDAERARLMASGHLDESSVFRNFWSEWRELPDDELGLLSGDAPARPQVPEPVGKAELASRFVRQFRDEKNVIRRVDHLRRDGTLLVADLRPEGKPRTLTMYARSGEAVRTWKRARDMYFAWLDHVFEAHPTGYLINDSTFIGGFIWDYSRPGVHVVHVNHSTHLDAGATSPFGPVPKRRLSTLLNQERFGLTTFLTKAQLDDVTHMGIDTSNARVIPNSRSGPAVGVVPRRRDAGAMISRLSVEKQVDHAIRSIALAQRTGAPGVSLDIYGEGPDRAVLEEQIAGDGVEQSVRLRGYTPNAADKLAEHGFLTLTSRYEGMGLVLVEAMAAGCLPIAYDIRYGPSDVITDGIDGFLVPADDEEALADAIKRASSLSPDEDAAMREAARRRARDFSDEAITRRWADYLREIPRQRPRASSPSSKQIETAYVGFDEHGNLRISATRATGTSPLRLTVSGRGAPYHSRTPVDQTGLGGGHHLLEVLVPPDRFIGEQGTIHDLHWLATGAPFSAAARVASPDSLGLRRTFGEWEIYRTVEGNVSLRHL